MSEAGYNIAVILALIVGVWFYRGHIDSLEAEADKLAAVSAARKTEGEWQEIYNALQKRQAAELDAIATRLDTAIAGLRQRPSRVPQEARAKCEGVTGRELSREDGEFLAREAARADALRSALTTCYDAIDTEVK